MGGVGKRPHAGVTPGRVITNRRITNCDTGILKEASRTWITLCGISYWCNIKPEFNASLPTFPPFLHRSPPSIYRYPRTIPTALVFFSLPPPHLRPPSTTFNHGPNHPNPLCLPNHPLTPTPSPQRDQPRLPHPPSHGPGHPARHGKIQMDGSPPARDGATGQHNARQQDPRLEPQSRCRDRVEAEDGLV